MKRPFTTVTVHRHSEAGRRFPWRDLLWFLCSPYSVFSVRALSPLERSGDNDQEFAERIRQALADSLQVHCAYTNSTLKLFTLTMLVQLKFVTCSL